MFSPRAENLLMPGRLPAAPRSRWRKLPLLAMSADQSPAIRARSPSHVRAARPLAWRSALRRGNRWLASAWAGAWGAAGGALVWALGVGGVEQVAGQRRGGGLVAGRGRRGRRGARRLGGRLAGGGRRPGRGGGGAGGGGRAGRAGGP